MPRPHRVKFASPSPGQVCLALGGIPRSSGHTPGRVCLALGGSSLPCPRWVKFASHKASPLRPPGCLLPPPEATGGPRGPPRIPLILLETIQANLPHLMHTASPSPTRVKFASPSGASLVPRATPRVEFALPYPTRRGCVVENLWKTISEFRTI